MPQEIAFIHIIFANGEIDDINIQNGVCRDRKSKL